MTVQTTPTVHVPIQAGPVEPPPAPTGVLLPSAPLVGRDRPLTADERSFAIGLAVMALVLGTIIVVGLLVGHYVWT